MWPCPSLVLFLDEAGAGQMKATAIVTDGWLFTWLMVGSLPGSDFCFWMICPRAAYQLATWVRKILNNKPGEVPQVPAKGEKDTY